MGYFSSYYKEINGKYYAKSIFVSPQQPRSICSCFNNIRGQLQLLLDECKVTLANPGQKGI